MSLKNNLILKFIIICLALLTAAGFYYYNKGPMDLHQAKGQKISAEELYREFIQDTSTQQKYSGTVLEVTGEIIEITQNQQQQTVILLKTGIPESAINCTLEDMSKKDIKAGSLVTIKGICNGMNDEGRELGIGGDIYLIRCYLK